MATKLAILHYDSAFLIKFCTMKVQFVSKIARPAGDFCTGIGHHQAWKALWNAALEFQILHTAAIALSFGHSAGAGWIKPSVRIDGWAREGVIGCDHTILALEFAKRIAND